MLNNVRRRKIIIYRRRKFKIIRFMINLVRNNQYVILRITTQNRAIARHEDVITESLIYEGV
jgi:hypothetical protein